MLGILPKAKVQHPQRQIPNWKLPKCAIYLAATSQRLSRPFQAQQAEMGARALRLGGQALRLWHTWEFAAWEVAYLVKNLQESTFSYILFNYKAQDNTNKKNHNLLWSLDPPNQSRLF